MNNKQKFGYTLLGALIMLIGIGVGAIVSPPLIAQRDGVFDEIQCRRLKTVDENGNEAAVLARGLIINSPSGKKEGIVLGCSELLGNYMWIDNKDGSSAMQFLSRESGNSINLFDSAGKVKIKLIAQSDIHGLIGTLDNAGEVKWIAIPSQ